MHDAANKEKEICDTIIKSIESQDPNSNTADTQKEILELAKVFRKYYTYMIENDADNATKEITLAYLSVGEIANKCFYGELPPKYGSLE